MLSEYFQGVLLYCAAAVGKCNVDDKVRTILIKTHSSRKGTNKQEKIPSSWEIARNAN